jgi:hypothetical protein
MPISYPVLHPCMLDAMNSDTMLTAEECAKEARALINCPICHDHHYFGRRFISAGDPDADGRAYARATISWKNGVRGFHGMDLAEVRHLIKRALQRSSDCPCARIKRLMPEGPQGQKLPDQSWDFKPGGGAVLQQARDSRAMDQRGQAVGCDDAAFLSPLPRQRGPDMAEGHLTRPLFAGMLRKIAALPSPADKASAKRSRFR